MYRLLCLYIILALYTTWPARADVVVPVKARPKMVGEKVPSLHGLTAEGQTQDLAPLMDGKLTLLALTGAIAPLNSSVRDYFNGIRPYIEELGYQIIVVAADSRSAIEKVAKLYKHRILIADEDRENYIAMGLADSKVHGDPLINGIFLVGPDQKIVFEFVSADPSIGINGEVLVLAAKNYRDLTRAQECKKEPGVK